MRGDARTTAALGEAMGGHPYWYVVPYEADVQAALDKLREREFRAGRYNPVMDFPPFPVTSGSPAPGAGHRSIQAAFEDADADGTRSIIDLITVVDEPYDPDSADQPSQKVFPVADEVLEEWFGMTKPTRAMVEDCDDMWESLDRGWGIHIVLYKDDRPDEIFFAGYSFD